MKFENKSREAKEALKRQIIAGLTKASLLVEGQAALLAPVDSGELRDSIGYKVDERRLIAYVGTNVDHGLYQEFGTGAYAEKGDGRKGGWAYKDAEGKWVFTKGNRPKPFLRPAFRRNKKAVKAILEDALRKVGE